MDNSVKIPLSFREWIGPLRRNAAISVVAFLAVVLTVACLTWTAQKVYEASATLLVRENAGQQGQLFELPAVAMQKNLIKNQVAVLESRAIAMETVQRLSQSVYRDSLSLLGNAPPRSTPFEPFWIRLGFKRPLPSDAKPPSLYDMMNAFQSSARVLYGRETDIVQLKAQAPSPWEAAVVVNTWIETYQSMDRSDNRSEITKTRQFLESKQKEMEKKLAASEKALSEYQKRNKLVSLPKETEQLVTQLASFESLYNQARTDMESLQSQYRFLKDQLDESKKNLIEDMVKVSNPVIQELQRQMAQLVADKAAYEAQLVGAGYDVAQDPKVIQMENRLTGVKDKIVEETKKLVQKDMANLNPLDRSENLITQILENETNQKSVGARIESLKNIIAEYTKKMAVLPDQSMELVRLERDVQTNTKIYVMLKENYEETRIREAGQTGLIQVVDRADYSAKLVRPRRAMNLLLGCFFGVLLGIGLAYGKEYLADTVKSERDLKAMGITVIGTVPSSRWKKRKGRTRDVQLQRAEKIYPYLLTNQNASSPLTEYFRTIRTTIYITGKPVRWQTLLVTSPWPAEGKSTTAANLAVSMARKGLRTLLVDSDLRKPVQDILFTGSHRKMGLSNLLRKSLPWAQMIRETSTQHLYLMPSGPSVANAPELLGSEAMIKLIRNLRNEFRMVVFDSPPVLTVTDATVLASVVDGVVLIVRSGQTTRQDVARAMESLQSVGATTVGAVLTGLHESDMYGYRYDYSHTPPIA